MTGFKPVAPTLRMQRSHPSDRAKTGPDGGNALNISRRFSWFLIVAEECSPHSSAGEKHSRAIRLLDTTNHRLINRPSHVHPHRHYVSLTCADVGTDEQRTQGRAAAEGMP